MLRIGTTLNMPGAGAPGSPFLRFAAARFKPASPIASINQCESLLRAFANKTKICRTVLKTKAAGTDDFRRALNRLYRHKIKAGGQRINIGAQALDKVYIQLVNEAEHYRDEKLIQFRRAVARWARTCEKFLTGDEAQKQAFIASCPTFRKRENGAARCAPAKVNVFDSDSSFNQLLSQIKKMNPRDNLGRYLVASLKRLPVDKVSLPLVNKLKELYSLLERYKVRPGYKSPCLKWSNLKSQLKIDQFLEVAKKFAGETKTVSRELMKLLVSGVPGYNCIHITPEKV